MPKIQKLFTLEVTPEKFLNSCTPEELMETSLLVLSPQYQNKIKEHLTDVECGLKPESKRLLEMIGE